ncbi:MAG: M23 family metallopeptidase [Rhodoglobus sp.]
MSLTRKQLRERERATVSAVSFGRRRAATRAAARAVRRQTSRRTKTLASHLFSGVVMLFAAVIIVGVSVPSNMFTRPAETIAAASGSAVASASASEKVTADSWPTQSMAVSGDAVMGGAQKDSLSVISYADVLALQYAGESYQYSATAGAIRWPFPYTVPITDGFGDRIGGFHKGTDFAAHSGTPIYAIADGVVSYVAADYSGYGYNAIISHVIKGQKVDSHYAHMISNSSPLVVGQPIRVGDFVGLVGETGISYGAHLHLEILLDSVPIDPFVWLTKNTVN